MNDVSYRNSRFDPELTGFHAIAQQMAQSVGYTATLSIDRQLAQLLRLRVAQLDPCSYCLILHTEAAREAKLHPAKVAHLPSWRESTMYTAAERAALAYTEALTTFDHVAFAARHDGLREFFDETAIAEIAAVVINMNVWTRIKLAQGAVPVLQQPDEPKSARVNQ
ncbi:MAG TPA: carboxymuconolactone decarboxylase family protein [Microbacterium sp.]|nr:carboxymuconolactone decarboxylase family protein [Microbacterium sp.]